MKHKKAHHPSPAVYHAAITGPKGQTKVITFPNPVTLHYLAFTTRQALANKGFYSPSIMVTQGTGSDTADVAIMAYGESSQWIPRK